MSRWKFKMYVKVTVISFSFLHTVFTSGCTSTKELNSEMFHGNFTVDARADEWRGKNLLDIGDKGFLIVIQNDITNVYICLMSTNRATERLMTAVGMIVWIESEHGKKFGIHYPLHLDKFSGSEGITLSGYRSEMDILGPEKDEVAQSSILTSESDYGIAAAFRDSAGCAVLEMKIPRKAKLEPYGAGTDNTLSMNIESGKIEKPAGGKHQSGGMKGSGRRRSGGGRSSAETPPEIGSAQGQDETYNGGGSGSSGRGSSGDRSGSDRTVPEPISFSLRVHLTQ
jgi:hypothetical protein